MADTYTNSLRIVQETIGGNENSWGTLNNAALAMLDEAIAGQVSVSVTAGDVTLTANNNATDQSRPALLILTGTPGATRNVTMPDVKKLTWVVNSTTDGSSVVVKSGAGTNVMIASGASAQVLSDGATNVAVLATTNYPIGITVPDNVSVKLGDSTFFNSNVLGLAVGENTSAVSGTRWAEKVTLQNNAATTGFGVAFEADARANHSSGVVNEVCAIDGFVSLRNAGNVTIGVSYSAAIFCPGTGVMTSYRAYESTAPAAGNSTIGTHTHFFGDVVGSAATIKVGVGIADTAAHNYFGGTMAVGSVTVSPSTSAALEVKSTTGAILVPRMTTTQKNALTPTNGMILYDTTLNKFQGYESGAWLNLI
jgi:hypothetical protein